jgi:3'(2'), 5'-bisphosphate nucleotidase
MTATADRPESDGELDAMVDVARRAAALVMQHYRGTFGVAFKGPGDPVTDVDRAANDLICGALASRFPHAAIVAEESVPADRSVLESLVRSPEIFYVDPIDGTREFVAGRPEFAVMIGLVRAGAVVRGVVALPAERLLLAGQVGGLAFAEGPDGLRQPLRVSRATDLRGARVVVSRARSPRWLGRLVLEAGLAPAVAMGSVGAKVAQLARGLSELYVHRGHSIKLWDCCAPAAVLAAAGGSLTDLDGRAIEWRSADLCLRRGMLGSNGLLHDLAVAAVARAESPRPSRRSRARVSKRNRPAGADTSMRQPRRRSR